MAKSWIEQTKNENESSWDSGNTEKPTMGRPKLSEAEKRKPRFTMSLNNHELKLLSDASKASGMSVALFMRHHAIKEANKIYNKE